MLDRIKEMLYAELEEYAQRSELTAGSLEALHKLTDTIKNIDKIEALEYGEYSQAGGESYDDGVSYARGGRRSSRHYVRAHYSRDRGGDYRRGGDYDRGGGYGGYSRDDGKQHMLKQMAEMMQHAENDRQRDAIRRCMDQLEQI